jgi:hypothetical protein
MSIQLSFPGGFPSVGGFSSVTVESICDLLFPIIDATLAFYFRVKI